MHADIIPINIKATRQWNIQKLFWYWNIFELIFNMPARNIFSQYFLNFCIISRQLFTTLTSSLSTFQHFRSTTLESFKLSLHFTETFLLLSSFKITRPQGTDNCRGRQTMNEGRLRRQLISQLSQFLVVAIFIVIFVKSSFIAAVPDAPLVVVIVIWLCFFVECKFDVNGKLLDELSRTRNHSSYSNVNQQCAPTSRQRICFDSFPH